MCRLRSTTGTPTCRASLLVDLVRYYVGLVDLVVVAVVDLCTGTCRVDLLPVDHRPVDLVDLVDLIYM
jgi:hypothetical protein